MRLYLVREMLLKPLQQVIGIMERKQILPILSNVLLSIENNQLSITGTDLEIELRGVEKLNKQDQKSCRLTLPGKKLMDICRSLPEKASIELTQDKERIVLRSGQSRFVLSTFPVDTFPTIEKMEYHLQLTMPQCVLYRLLQKTHFSMAYNDVRYYLNGLLLEIYTNKLRTVATDGHRLSINTSEIENTVKSKLRIILPRKGITELLRLLTNKEDCIVLTIGNNHVRISTGDFVFTSKLIEGRFPDYERVIPKGGDKQIRIDRDLLKQAINRMAILCNEKFRGIRFELRHRLLRISSYNIEQEMSEEEIEIDYIQNKELDIGLNVNYLLDILRVVNRGNITLTFSDANSGVLIAEDTTSMKRIDSSFVVMPMRL
ncbi:DNA polymerase III subunit beta [Coxiella endosymbiont of Amblyomma sculptum]|uniref:DNA polymerase III subunit beta n=1 Tax=Coxiella endosymbiont of Amblyomma sculptum TaxID=2487929 RepID=UPI00132F2737|nr:DNA polymerase III subunit beta [Coxiella endosymbiont of Amblyomma sculptum]QHG92659.1 DNA polymerase III subunit beta [Coxiella endosymbiont of Amblyomma sculptum]